MKTIGVDLGTTNSCVYYLDADDNPVLVSDRLKRKTFPSVVWCAGPGKEVVVGHAAKNRLGQLPTPVATIKRKIGTTETVQLGGQQVSPIHVSAQILTFLKSLVEEVTGDSVGAAVVTVPAYFDSSPKKDTYRAAVEAFFGGDAALAKGRLELQLEPEAAAFAYTLEDPAEHLRILAYDLGGGTFDVTVLEKSPASGLSVLKFGGDPHLGGDNIDDRIAAWILYLLRGGRPEALDRILDPARYPVEEQYTVLQQLLTNDTVALRGVLRGEDRELLIEANPLYSLALDPANPEDLPRIQRLKALAEAAKMNLTVATETAITQQNAFADHAGNLVDVDLTLDRATFNRLIGDFVSRTLEETSRVLQASGLTADQIDCLILVGGSTRMPVIREELEERFPCPVKMADPDLIVARGAAFKARQLSLTATGPSDSRLQLEYPRKTPDERVLIKGIVARSTAGSMAYLSRSGEDLAEVALEGDRFLFDKVPLVRNAPNPLHLEVTDADGALLAEADLTIVHDERAVVDTVPLGPKITKSICVQGIHGFETLFPEGTQLPARTETLCYRGTSEDRIVIPFFEGDRWMTNLVVTGVDRSLPEGAPIDLQASIDKDFTCSTTATVRQTRQTATVDFEISQTEIPSIEELDSQLRDALEEFENDIATVRDREVRVSLVRRQRRIEADYEKAKRALTPDKLHLYGLVGELRGLLIDVRTAHDLLQPPREDFAQLVTSVRELAKRLSEDTTLRRDETLDKVASLECAGSEAWERQDAAVWKSINEQLGKLQEDIERLLATPTFDPWTLPPENIQAQLLAWLGELREKAEDAGLDSRFAAEIEDAERIVRQVDLHRDRAKEQLRAFTYERLQPLDKKITRAIREQGGTTPDDGSTVPNIYFRRNSS